jgi:hypothetical protein
MSYIPDNWVVIFMNGDAPHYRILAGWSGGYITSDSWRMNSGIVGVSKSDHVYHFQGYSGSTYSCHADLYGLRNNNSFVMDKLKNIHGEKVTIMPEDTDWVNVDWIIK